MKQHHRLQAAILLFENFTALDAVGPYEVLSRMPDTDVVFVGENTGQIRNDTGSLGLAADASLAEVPHPDLIVVPGGPGQNAHMSNGAVHQWLRQADATSAWTTSVCTGSLILAAAGLLTGKRATTHWLALETLGKYGARATAERVVFDGKYVTAAGVSAGIDMGLALTGAIAGTQAAQGIQLGLEYDPQPPFAAGSPQTAPPAVVNALRARKTTILGTSPAAL
ncbi:MAG TPA: DJ-1/PfpI family protein [Arthrobacter sp.]|nr:DJ-1/PfpI family protein [Arthrobacter sp.]